MDYDEPELEDMIAAAATTYGLDATEEPTQDQIQEARDEHVQEWLEEKRGELEDVSWDYE